MEMTTQNTIIADLVSELEELKAEREIIVAALHKVAFSSASYNECWEIAQDAIIKSRCFS
jgi:hypothetical protein